MSVKSEALFFIPPSIPKPSKSGRTWFLKEKIKNCLLPGRERGTSNANKQTNKQKKVSKQKAIIIANITLNPIAIIILDFTDVISLNTQNN